MSRRPLLQPTTNPLSMQQKSAEVITSFPAAFDMDGLLLHTDDSDIEFLLSPRGEGDRQGDDGQSNNETNEIAISAADKSVTAHILLAIKHS